MLTVPDSVVCRRVFDTIASGTPDVIMMVAARWRRSWTRMRGEACVADATVKYLVRDRDSKYTAAFDAVFEGEGITITKTGIRVPRMNAIMERWARSCRAELLDRILIVNRAQLMHALREYETFYNEHRSHRALRAAARLRPLPNRSPHRNGSTAST